MKETHERNCLMNKSSLQMRMDAEDIFQFNCSPGLSCFTQCCQDVTIVLTPYDILRLKKALGIPSNDFLDNYTIILPKENRLIPLIILKMNEEDKNVHLYRKTDVRFMLTDHGHVGYFPLI